MAGPWDGKSKGPAPADPPRPWDSRPVWVRCVCCGKSTPLWFVVGTKRGQQYFCEKCRKTVPELEVAWEMMNG